MVSKINKSPADSAPEPTVYRSPRLSIEDDGESVKTAQGNASAKVILGTTATVRASDVTVETKS